MSYKRHTALDLASAASQVVSAIPTTEELILTIRGEVNSGGASDVFRVRPNSDSGANYGGASHYVNNTPSEGSVAGITDGLNIGRGGSGGYHQVTMRLTKRANLWFGAVHFAERNTANSNGEAGYGFTWWNSAGAALSTLQFRWDVTTAAARFTGRVEVWYQDA